jgi:hypothetical protein
MAINMTREEMIDDLVLTWQKIQQLDPETSFSLDQLRKDCQTRPNDLLEVDYNQARYRLWQLISNARLDALKKRLT